MNQVSDNNQVTLRERGLMGENEIAYTRGDLLVIVNVVTEEKRVLGSVGQFLIEGVEKRVLKG
jgi:hypothetical protein